MTPEQQQKLLAQAEAYCKKALELVPTLPKPDGITDQQFIAAKNEVQALAYSGLGLVAFRRSKYAEAIPNLEQSAKYDANPDPVIYFILGICNEKSSHFDDAISAFTKMLSDSELSPANLQGGNRRSKKTGEQLS